jgi:hypothetical protein
MHIQALYKGGNWRNNGGIGARDRTHFHMFPPKVSGGTAGRCPGTLLRHTCPVSPLYILDNAGAALLYCFPLLSYRCDANITGWNNVALLPA